MLLPSVLSTGLPAGIGNAVASAVTSIVQKAGPKAGASIHAVFFHGLSGHPESTWTARGGRKEFWPAWLVDDVSGLAVWTAAYPAAAFRWLGRGLHYKESALSLLAMMVTQPGMDRGEIALIGHSFGGLVIKQILRTASDNRTHGDGFADWLDRTRRVGFLATPHMGAPVASLANRLRMLCPSAATAALVRGDPNLTELNQWYKGWSFDHDMHTLSLSERTRVCGLSVVEADSATPGTLDLTYPVEANHFDICKPASRDDQVYVYVRDLLSRGRLVSKPSERVLQLLRDAEVPANVSRRTIVAGMRLAPETAEAELRRRIARLRRARFFAGEHKHIDAEELAEAVLAGQFDGALRQTLGVALAWCARVLSRSDKLEFARQLVARAKEYGAGEIGVIAEAFVASTDEGLAPALRMLSGIRSPMALCAMLQIRSHEEGAQAAVAWFRAGGFGASDLDAEGRLVLLTRLLETGAWDEAWECRRRITVDDFDEVPALYMVVALSELVEVVAADQRLDVLAGVPLDLQRFPLADDAQAMQRRREAHAHFLQAAEASRNMGYDLVALSAEDYGLWLELRDPDCATARDRLEQALRDPQLLLRRVRYALQFGLTVDRAEVEREIDREWALSNGTSRVAATARYCLAMGQSEPGRAVDYLLRHRSQISTCIEEAQLDRVEVELLSRAGRAGRIEQRLAEMTEEGVDPNHIAELRRIAEECSSATDANAARQRFEVSKSTADLSDLVRRLFETGNWEEVADCAATLFERTRAVPDLEQLSFALYRMERSSELVARLSSLDELRRRSRLLTRLWIWGLYREGRLNEAGSALSELPDVHGDAEGRSLYLGIAIASGSWGRVSHYAEQEWGRRTERSGVELLQAAQVARVAGSTRVRDLVAAAVERSADDAEVLLGAYLIATSAGWEDETTAAWLERAGRLSGGEGPLRSVSLEEIVALQPQWIEQTERTVRALRRGEIPHLLAARQLNRTLLDLYLLRALANEAERDPRRRVSILSNSGVRRRSLEGLDRIGLDVTSLVILAYLDLLDPLLGTFEFVAIPHLTLPWLFDALQRWGVHQPARVRDARRTRELLTEEKLTILSPAASVDTALAAMVGDELALLVAEATSAQRAGRVAFVVRSAPVHRVAASIREEADMSPHFSVLRSCSAVVRALREKGRLTETECDRALNVLRVRESGWQADEAIPDEATLFLDDLALTYLDHVGILGKLREAGFVAVVSPQSAAKIDELLRFDRLSADASEIVERLRRFLEHGIESGVVRVAPAVALPDAAEDPSLAIVTSVLGLVGMVDAIAIDDHFSNRLERAEYGSRSTPFATALDVLAEFRSRGRITRNEEWDALRRLRTSQFALVPVSTEEVVGALSGASTVGGEVLETAEFRAIRENLLCVRMTDDLSFPSNLTWFVELQTSLFAALRAVWGSEGEVQVKRAKSGWLLSLADCRRWAQCIDSADSPAASLDRWRAQVLALLIGDADLPISTRQEYWRWVEEEVLDALRQESPQLYRSLLESAAELVGHIAAQAEQGDA